MEPEALTAEHAWVMERWNAAEVAAAAVTELAHARIEARWGERSNHPKDFGIGYWATYPCLPDSAGGDAGSSETWRSAVFEWGLPDDDGRAEARDAAVFNAGVTFTLSRSNPAALEANAEWLAARRAEGFEYISRDYWRLMRFKYPQELLAASTLQEQAELLADWVLESFDLLAANPPPA